MKRLTMMLVLGMVLSIFSGQAFAQVNVQVIHNSPDPLADSVDIYLDGVLAVSDLKFREATEFLAISSSTSDIGVAPGNSTSVDDTVANFPVILQDGVDYIIVANGVLTTANYDQTLYGGAIAFDLEIYANALQNSNPGFNDILVFHGSSDAPSVDALANGVPLPLIDDLDYASFQGYAPVPSTEYILDITPFNNNALVVGSFYVDISPLTGLPLVLVASGFLDPSNNSNGPEFGLFAYSANGGPAIPLTVVGTAPVQVIHNSADPLADTVDIYVNTISDTIKLDNVAFRNATGFLDLPTGYELDIRVSDRTSTGYGDQEVATFPATLDSTESYTVIANGVVGTGFASNPSGVDSSFNLYIATGARQEAQTAGNFELNVFHGSTDAPAVGVNANGGQAIPSAAYTDFSGYLSIAPDRYRFDVTAANDPSNILFRYAIDASGFGDVAAVVFASGFLDPSSNNGGPDFGLFAVTPVGGEAIELTLVGDARAQVIHNSADPVADTVDIYVNTLADTLKLDNVAFRNASMFLDLPTDYEIDIRVSGRTSTGYGDQEIATFVSELEDGESYAIIANGVVGTGFASNPSGRDSSFNLFITTGARETVATAGNFELNVFHGSTDAPAVGVNANGGQVIPSAAYGDFAGYLSVAPGEYRFDVTAANDPANVLFPFYVDASGFGDVPAIVFASGFIDPSANNGGPGFGLFATTPAGGEAIALTPVGTGQVQVIHNAADTLAKTVDIYVNTLADTIKLDDVNFRDGTSFLGLPSGYPLQIQVSGPNSAAFGDAEAIQTFPATLDDGEAYHVIANGLLDTMGYTFPAGRNVDFTLFIEPGARQAQINGNSDSTDVKVFHGATDAPAVDVIINGNAGAKLVDNLDYGNATGYATVQSISYDLGVGANPVTAPGDVLATFEADLSGAGGGAGIVVASGFLNAANNNDGVPFGLVLFLPDNIGQGLLLPLVTNIDDLIVSNESLNVFPNPALDRTQISFDLVSTADVAFRLYDLNGRVVWESDVTKTAGAHQMELDLTSIAGGNYTLVMMYENRVSYQRLQIAK
ncbi:MAG: DUF4397 domain-containing protein [Bacteroidota bacterium]